jgi:hypothetical protein
LLVPLALLLFPAALPAQTPGPSRPSASATKQAAKENARLRKVLAFPIDFPSKGDENLIDDKSVLGEILDVVADRYDVSFAVDEAAFRAAAGGKPFDLLGQKVFEKPFPKLVKVSFKTCLRLLLARVVLPSKDEVTFVVQGGVIEITTLRAWRARIWGEKYKGPYLPVVDVLPQRRPLGKVLEELAADSGFNIVQDPRAARQLRTPVAVNLRDTPLDTAVLVLADMAGLRAVLKDNVLYVTTPENAPRLEQQAQQNRAPSARPMSRVKE